jgi:CO dehydrogenase maturation factor
MSKSKEFKIVITGKGGVGKTTLTSCLSKLLATKGMNVLAVDEDPQMNLPYALGIPVEKASKIIPLNKNLDYIEEKTGVRPGKSWGNLFRLNPRVEDVVERFGIKINENLSLLVMGTVIQAAAGCLCAENVLLDSVIKHLSLKNDEMIILDTQAGMEHFGRALAKGFSQCIVISDNTFNALSVAEHSAELAKQLGIPYVHLAVNKIKGQKESQLNKYKSITGKNLEAIFDGIFYLPLETKFEELEPDITKILNEKSAYVDEIENMVNQLMDYQKKHITNS